MGYHITRQNRKTIAIHVDEEANVIIKVPKYLTLSEVNQFVKKNESWIKNRVHQQMVMKQNNDWRMTKKILYLGEYINILIKPCVYYKTQVILANGQLIVEPAVGSTDKDVGQLIENFYKKEAKEILTVMTQQYASLLRVKYNKITVRKQKTRWGSCSSKGNLSYNIKILCASREMIEYIVLHEVMHLKYFNHGKDFWKSIAEIMPDYKERMNYFKQFGQNFII
ncbi:MAG: family metallopeptidase [Clostridia bacterium]|jgi:predicted metal-dependent hydrolase|nr:family metallopeptidase [Clostridia bacterium]